MKSTPQHYERRVLAAWQQNVEPWVAAIDGGEIESRQQVTDAAIIDLLASLPAASLLDIGCGEGWLCRALAQRGLVVTGVDAVAAFVEIANSRGGGQFLQLDYQALATAPLGRFDIMVCNFSLLGEASVEAVFSAAAARLNPGGHLVVQTLHPLTACGDQPYESGWREGSWDGFSREFGDPAPWYFRTLEDWQGLFSRHGLELVAQREPCRVGGSKPVSLLLVGRCGG